MKFLQGLSCVASSRQSHASPALIRLPSRYQERDEEEEEWRELDRWKGLWESFVLFGLEWSSLFKFKKEGRACILLLMEGCKMTGQQGDSSSTSPLAPLFSPCLQPNHGNGFSLISLSPAK
ncbi:hypothetical protein TIFTF001_046599 [Ficus carica]|uniref:Uncharacterized protein n=1 Tax=Ficus carica TaxID=3494 RepID=A0AA87ZI91_FICCA|nr:hypothetical protein TIFTF001_046599 [Ficus carica]